MRGARQGRRWLGALGVAATVALGPGCGGDGGGEGGVTPPPSTTGAIAGQVREGSVGVAGAQLALAGPVTRTAASDAQGRYGFVDLPPGGYSLALTPPSGYRLASGETNPRGVTVVAGQTATVDWRLERSGGGGTTVVTVRLSGTSFTPSDITIAPGTTVRWVVDDGSHTITPDNPNQPGAWTSVAVSAGQTFEHTFTVAGQTYNYHCIPHRSLGMVGVVRVP